MRKTILFLFGIMLTGIMSGENVIEVKGVRYELNNGNAKVIHSENAKGVIDIPDMLTYAKEKYEVTEIGDSAFFDCSYVTDVKFGQNIRKIGDFAFTNTSITRNIYTKTDFAYLNVGYEGAFKVPNGIRRICGGAFLGCGDMTKVLLPKSVTEIGKHAFLGSGITEPVFTEKVFAYMPYTFKGAYEIPEGIEEIAEYAFYGCDELTRIKIPESVGKIEEKAFYQCLALDSVKIPSGCTEIEDYAFYECKGMTHITLHDGIKSIGEYAFAGCATLIKINLPRNLKEIESHAFYDCRWLSPELDFSKTAIEEIGEYAFWGCIALQKVNLGNVKEIGNSAFEQCNSLTELKGGEKAEKIGGRIIEKTMLTSGPTIIGRFFVRMPEDKTGVYTIPDGVEEICDDAFFFCTKLEEVIIPATVKNVNENAFRYSKAKISRL